MLGIDPTYFITFHFICSEFEGAPIFVLVLQQMLYLFASRQATPLNGVFVVETVEARWYKKIMDLNRASEYDFGILS